LILFCGEAIMRSFLLATLLASAGLASAPATGTADESNLLVLPIITELQRSAFGSRPSARAYVLVNGKALVDGDAVRWKALDFDALRKALTPLKQGKDAAVIFRIFYDGSNQSEAPRLLRWALVGFGREEVGFRDAHTVTTIDGSFDWEKHLAAINDRTVGRPDADEALVGNDAVKVSSVRTALSRHLFGNADCVVSITQPFDERWDGKLPAELDKAIREHVAKLKLSDKGKLLVRFRYKAGGQDAATRFYLGAAKELAESLGFERHATEQTQVP